MRTRFWLWAAMVAGVSACANGGTTHQKASDQTSQDLQEGDLTAADLRNELTIPADAVLPDVPEVDVPGPLEAQLTVSGEALNDAAFHMEMEDFQNDQLVVNVVGSGLGKIAGLAFTLTWSPAHLELVGLQNLVDLGSSGSTETRSVTRELAPGRVAFGVARFCLAKMPWGKTDQCGGVVVDDSTPVAQLTFKVVQPGRSPLIFDAATTLVRRPDRSSVQAHWLNANVKVER